MPLTKKELRDSFVEDVQRINSLYGSLSKHTINSEQLVLAEQTIVSLTVALESYVSELLVLLISENPALFLTNMSQEMKTALLKAGFSHLKIQYLAHEGPKKVDSDELRDIVLNDGDNLAFPETRMLREFVKKNLQGNIAFEITPEDELFIDVLKGTRNLCAHHSQKAARALSGMHKKYLHDQRVNSSEVCLTLVQDDDITLGNLGDYLKKQVPGSSHRDRIDYVATYLRAMVFRWVK